MSDKSVHVGDRVVVQRAHMQAFLDALSSRNYQLIGPTVRDSAIVYDEIDSVEDLPIGWTDEQNGGTYRLRKRQDEALFGYSLGPQSWKKFLHLPKRRLWQAERQGENFAFVAEPHEIPKRAFIGVRSCEINAINIHDKVFTHGPYIDPLYKMLRDNSVIIAVNCGQAGGTCFCASMNTGPKVTSDFDLALTEILTADSHVFLVEVGTKLGADIIQVVPHEPSEQAHEVAAQQIIDATTRNMGRSVNISNVKDLLYANHESHRWEEVASRCLTCGNCTTVCPTCFCVTVEDVTDLSGDHAERWQRWDSCFTMDFSYIHGGSVRASGQSRYRQWITHKMASWIDQFGTLGCVGCGRCITWCPVGIDITAEVRALQESEEASSAAEISTLNAV